MDSDQILLTHELKPVAGVELLAPHEADLAVDLGLAILDQNLGLTAGGDRIGQLQRGLQLDELRADDHRNLRVFTLRAYNNFPSILLTNRNWCIF